MTPQPVDGLPSEPGIWKMLTEFPIEILDGIPFLLDHFEFWHPVTCESGWEWVRPFRPGDPRIRPEPPKPPLPDADHRHADGCPHDGLWVFRCDGEALELRRVNGKCFGMATDHRLPWDISYAGNDRFLRYVGQPSDFVPPPAVVPPAIEPCPYCGGEAKQLSSIVQCTTESCEVMGPSDDPDGAKWNRVARAARGEQP